MKYPAKEGKPFRIRFYQDCYRKGEVISSGLGHLKIIKVYNRTWWRRLLNYFGFKTKWFDCVKVKPIYSE